VIDFLGITRERVYSPGRVEDDAAVLNEVARHLGERGHQVRVFDADSDQWPQPAAGTLVFAMCQGPRALGRLRAWEGDGVRVINRPDGILNCQRHRTIPLLNDAGVGLPASVLVDTTGEAKLPAWIDETEAWVKRGDVHATEADDVRLVADAAQARAALKRFSDRGIAAAVIQRHAPGVVLKFYAVRGSFFHCVRTAETPDLPDAVLREIDARGRAAAERLGVEVYGGDCVYGTNSALSLIDLNDWPSYRSCRASAAVAIADYLRAQKEPHT
jgi:hypothetical protein